MKKKVLAALCCAAMIGSLAAAPVFAAEETSYRNGDYKIAVITMDSVDQHWVSLKREAQGRS